MRDLIILAVLGSIFFTFMLGNRPLSVPDEGRYVEIPREMVETGNYLTPRLNYVKYFEKPVLFYWLEAFSIKLFGIHEFTLRLWPAIFGLLGCLAVAVSGARLFGRKTGILAAIVLGTSVLYFALSRAIILDMPVSIFLTVGLLSFLLGTHQNIAWKRRACFWIFAASCAFAVLTKGLIGIVIPGMIIFAWIAILGEWRLLKTMYIPSSLALFLFIAAPWHIIVSMVNPEFFNFYFIHEHFNRYLTTVHGRYQPKWFFAPILLLGLFPWSAFLIQAIAYNLPSSWKERHEHRDVLFLMLWAALVFLFFSASDSKLIPYILPVLPPLALLLGRYFSSAWERHDFPGMYAGYIILSVLAVVGLLVAFNLHYFIPETKEVELRMLGFWPVLLLATLALGSFAALLLAKYRGFRVAFIALAACAALVMLEGNAVAPRADKKSIKELAVTLKPLLKPGDEVASYGTYYQDLPVYIQRRITVVDWEGELEFGTTVEDTSQWMIKSATFWQRWLAPSQMYMLTKREYYEGMKSNPRLNLFLIDGNSRDVLLSNKKIKEAVQ